LFLFSAKLRQLRESNRRNNPVENDVDTFLFLDADSAVDNPNWQPSSRLVGFTIDIGLYMCYNKKPKSGSEHIPGSSYYLWQLCQDMATIFLYEFFTMLTSSDIVFDTLQISNIPQRELIIDLY
jgi:hypothetical protein